MTHKANPKTLRIQGLEDWDSRWFSKKNQAKFLEEDYKIRKILTSKEFSSAGIERVEIERIPGQLKVIIKAARPGVLIGRGGQGIEALISKIKKKVLSDFQGEVKIEVLEVKDPWSSAQVVAQWIARQIEKRLPYRSVMKQALSRIMLRKGVKGAKVEVSGRLGGAEIARREWLREGKLPKNTFREYIDYGFDQAFCTYGVIGVKVWIYREKEVKEEV